MQGLILLVILGLSSAEPLRSDDELRLEIEDAAADSRQLADDLAGMLARLEAVENLETEAVEVLEENAGVEEALEEMINRIENLAALTVKQGSGSVEAELEQEEELHDTLIELENVAKEIEIVASTNDDSATSADIEKMAKILKEVSNRIKGVEEGSGKSRKTASKKSKKKSSKDSKIEQLLSNLLKEGSGLSAEDDSSESGDYDVSEETSGQSVDGEESGDQSGELSEDLTDVVEDDTSRSQESRRPKQLDDGLAEEEDEEPKETCDDKQQSNRVQVCTPDFQNRESNLKFYSHKPVHHQYCFNVTKTVCEERSQTVSKEVCTYEYQQKEVIAPARLAEIGYERLFEGFYITKCEKKLVKDGYKEKEVEVCYKEDVNVPYRLPTVTERIDDFVELAAPVPEKRCRLVKYDIPEVVCKDMVNKECVTLYSLEKDTVQARVSEVVQQYRGNCEYRELEQTTQLCTVEEKVKRPSYQSSYNAYRG